MSKGSTISETIVFRLLQPPNASVSIPTLSPRIKEVRPLQFAKARLRINEPLGIIMDVRLLQPLKASSPIRGALVKITVFRLLQPPKAYSPISAIPIEIEVRLLLLKTPQS